MNVESRSGDAELPGAAGSGRQASRLAHGAIAGLLLVAAMLRVVLVAGGGQFFFPDETRYQASREAAALLAAGKVKAGLLLPFANSEHDGFKVLGLAPALLEQWLGRDDRIPALFFSGFSLLVVVMIWLLARRLGGPPAGQIWATLLAVGSSSLLIYGRHLFPYDASLALGLTAWYVGLKAGGWRRSAAAGVLAGAAFVTYLGYWTLTGTVLLLHVFQPGARRHWWRRALAAAGGAGAVVAGGVLLMRMATGSALTDALRFASTVNQGDFREGYRLPWEYLWASDGLLLWLWLAAVVYAIGRWWRCRRGGTDSAAPLALCLGALGALYAAQVIASNGLGKFVVYGRVARLLVPFFCILTGLVLATVGRTRRWRRPLLASLAVLVAISTAARFRHPLTQEFPREFRAAGDALLRRLPPTGPDAYYRYVNVIHYLFAPERLKYPPAETLLAAAHPYQYRPYLFEGFTAQQRRLRLSVDQRMRLVRMVVPPNERVTGEPYGMITLRLRFPDGHAGFAEPLLSIGPRGDGELFFIRYQAGGRAVFGFESMGNQVITTDPVDVSSPAEHVLQLFSGALAPPADQLAAGGLGARQEDLKNVAYLCFDDRQLIDTLVPRHRAGLDEVYVGINAVEAGSAGDQFGGEVLGASRGGLPPVPPSAPQSQDAFGAVELTLIAPAAGTGVPEPLVVVGVTGRGVLGFIKNLPDGSHQFGVEVWSVGAWASEPLRLKPGAAAKVVFSFGSLLPPVGSEAWGAVPADEQQRLKREICVTVDGTEVLSTTHATPDFDHPPIHVGVNPIGGSYVGARFAGDILLSRQLPVEASAAPMKR
jgi:hypothetical protein